MVCLKGQGCSVALRMEKEGFIYDKVYGDFTTGSKGKDMLSQVVLPLPEISVYKRCKEDALLLVACDGIWDVMDNSTACEKVLETKKTWMKVYFS